MPPRKRRNLKMENKVPNQVEESEDDSSSNEEYESNEDDSSSSEAESESKEDECGGEEESESKEDDGGAEEEYEVEKIVGKRRKKGKVQYRLKWKGWDDSYNSWQNKKECYCPELIEEYEKTCRGELEEEELQITPGVSKMKERNNSEEHHHSSPVKNNGNYLLFEKSNSDSTCSTKIQKRKLSSGEENVSKRIRTYSHDFESRGSSPDNKKVHDSKAVNNKHLWALPQNKTIVKPNHEVDHQHFSNIEKKIDFGKIDYLRLDSRTDSSPRLSRTESSDDEAKQSSFLTEAKLDSLCKKMEEDSALKLAKRKSSCKVTKVDSSRQRTKIGSSHYQKHLKLPTVTLVTLSQADLELHGYLKEESEARKGKVLTPEKIVGLSILNGGLVYVIKWLDGDDEGDYITFEEAHERYPQFVLNFYTEFVVSNFNKQSNGGMAISTICPNKRLKNSL